MTVRLGFAVAAHLEPEILVVDEVLAVGDAEFQKKAIGKMQDLSTGEGRTVLFVSHNMAVFKIYVQELYFWKMVAVYWKGIPLKVVEQYISGNRTDLKQKVEITDAHRKFEVSGILQLEKVSIENVKPTTREKISFYISFELKKEINYELCCTGSICTLDDVRIGSFFSNSFFPKLGNNQIELIIDNHNLSIGTYYLNIAISEGKIEHDNLKMLDHAYDVITFEISKENTTGVHLTEWNTNWGKLFLQSQVNLIND